MSAFAVAFEVSNPALGSEVALAPLLATRPRAECGPVSIEAIAPQHDDAVQALARLCERAGCAPKAIRHISVSLGPGGFTAVRVALTSARLLAEATGATLVGVPSAVVASASTLHALSHSLDHSLHHALHPSPTHCLVLLASKGDSAWCSILDASTHRELGGGAPPEPALAPGLRTTAQLAELLDRWQAGAEATSPASQRQARPTIVALGDEFVPAPMRELLQRLGIAMHTPRLSAEACLRQGLLATTPDAPSDLLSLQPIYPREPEAVTKWRARKASS
jgi:tRNA A37 threonylcarbamoyladenosine modification protein TsaB